MKITIDISEVSYELHVKMATQSEPGDSTMVQMAARTLVDSVEACRSAAFGDDVQSGVKTLLQFAAAACAAVVFTETSADPTKYIDLIESVNQPMPEDTRALLDKNSKKFADLLILLNDGLPKPIRLFSAVQVLESLSRLLYNVIDSPDQKPATTSEDIEVPQQFRDFISKIKGIDDN